MKKHLYDEKNGLSYTLHGDYYLPDLELPEEEPAIYGKYGILCRTFLKEYRKATYSMLLARGMLTEHLNRVDQEANARLDMLVQQMVDCQGVTEQLKAENQMLWVGMMNNIRSAAEEVVLAEIVYC